MAATKASQPFKALSGSAGLALGTDLVVTLVDNESKPFTTPLPNGSLALEDLSATLGFGNGWYRIVDLPVDGLSKTLFVVEINENAEPFYIERLDDLEYPLESLVALFTPTMGNAPVTVSVTDILTSLPLAGVQIGIWNNDLTVAEVPMLTTSTAGIAKTALPPGTHKVFAFKSFVSFDSQQPYTLVVPDNNPATISFTGRVQVLAEPTFNRVTLYGRVLKADGTPHVGAEIHCKVANPNQSSADASFSRTDVVVLTDEAGYFELVAVADLIVTLECPATGYSRRAKLPRSGSMNWNNFGLPNT